MHEYVPPTTVVTAQPSLWPTPTDQHPTTSVSSPVSRNRNASILVATPAAVLFGRHCHKVVYCRATVVVVVVVPMEIDEQVEVGEVVVTESQTVWRDVQEKLREEDFEKAIQLCNKSEETNPCLELLDYSTTY